MAALLAILSSLKIGLGLPNSDKSLHNGRLLVDIARRAEQLGFSTLGTIGRVAFPSYEELITLGAAAAVTERTGLMTDILLAATWEPVLLAKQAATLDQISGGRFVLGIGAGGRPDDFSATGFGFDDRGKRLDAALDLMHRAWRGETIPGTGEVVTPRPVTGHSVPVMFGGQSENAVRRVAKHGIGYTLGGGDPTALSGMMERVKHRRLRGSGRLCACGRSLPGRRSGAGAESRLADQALVITACLFTAAPTLPSRRFLFVGCADLAVGGLNLTQKVDSCEGCRPAQPESSPRCRRLSLRPWRRSTLRTVPALAKAVGWHQEQLCAILWRAYRIANPERQRRSRRFGS